LHDYDKDDKEEDGEASGHTDGVALEDAGLAWADDPCEDAGEVAEEVDDAVDEKFVDPVEDVGDDS